MAAPEPPTSPMQSEDKSQAPIPDLNAETLMPIKGVSLSVFAKLVWGAMIAIILSFGWLAFSKFDIDRLRGPDHFVDKARAAVDAKDWPAALAAIQKVPAEGRNEPRFWRLLADYLIGTRTEPAVLAQALEKIKNTPLASEADSVWLANAYLAQGRPGPARLALDHSPPSQRETLMYMEVHVALLKAEGQNRRASEVERLLFNRFANDPGVAIRKAATELTGTFSEIREAALKRLWDAAAHTDEHGLAAIRVLTRDRGLSAIEASRLLKQVSLHNSATITDRLAIASAMIRLAPGERNTILEREIERHHTAPPEELQQLIAWLAKEHAFNKIVRLVPRDALLRSAELFPAVAQDLAQREQWSDLMRLIEKGRPLPVSNARAANWRALASRNLNPADTRAARAHLEEAIAEGLGRRDMQALMAAITLAEQWNMSDLALDATLQLAAAHSPTEEGLLNKCWQLASQLKQEHVLARIAERLVQLRPDSFLFARRHDYIRLLRGQGIEMTLSQVAASPPGNADLLLAALKAYRLGDISSSASTVAKIHNAEDFTSGEAAVYAGLLAKACGQVGIAYKIAEKVRTEMLLPSEKAFLDLAF